MNDTGFEPEINISNETPGNNGSEIGLESDTLHRIRILYLYKLLYEQTDDGHGLTMPEIIKRLGEQGIKVARKAVYGDLKALEAFNVDVNYIEGKYCILRRKFELAELTALADQVVNSHSLPPAMVNMLIEKLSSLCSANEAERLRPLTDAAENTAIRDMPTIYNIDPIYQAIAEKRKIKFDYFEYTYDYQNKRVEKISPEKRVCSPIALAWNDGKYYLIAYYDKYNSISHFRMDKIGSIELLSKSKKDKAAEPPKDFRLSEYMRSTFSMFSGDPVDVTIRFENSLMNTVIDRFGEIQPEHDGREHFKVTVQIRVSPDKPPAQFFGWLFQFGTKAQIIAPGSISSQYFQMLKEVFDNKYID